MVDLDFHRKGAQGTQTSCPMGLYVALSFVFRRKNPLLEALDPRNYVAPRPAKRGLEYVFHDRNQDSPTDQVASQTVDRNSDFQAALITQPRCRKSKREGVMKPLSLEENNSALTS